MQGLIIDKSEKYSKEVNDLIQSYYNVDSNNPSKLIILQAEEIEELNPKFSKSEDKVKYLLSKTEQISKSLESILGFEPNSTLNPLSADVIQLTGAGNNDSLKLS